MFDWLKRKQDMVKIKLPDIYVTKEQYKRLRGYKLYANIGEIPQLELDFWAEYKVFGSDKK
jgi:hypothetical protein